MKFHCIEYGVRSVRTMAAGLCPRNVASPSVPFEGELKPSGNGSAMLVNGVRPPSWLPITGESELKLTAPAVAVPGPKPVVGLKKMPIPVRITSRSVTL